MTCYCGALDCPSCGPAQGAGYASDVDDGEDDNAEAAAEDRAMAIRDAEDAEPAESLDGRLFRDR